MMLDVQCDTALSYMQSHDSNSATQRLAYTLRLLIAENRDIYELITTLQTKIEELQDWQHYHTHDGMEE